MLALHLDHLDDLKLNVSDIPRFTCLLATGVMDVHGRAWKQATKEATDAPKFELGGEVNCLSGVFGGAVGAADASEHMGRLGENDGSCFGLAGAERVERADTRRVR